MSEGRIQLAGDEDLPIAQEPVTGRLEIILVSDPTFYTLETDKDTHFTGAIAQNAKEDENLTGLQGDKIVITDVMIESEQNLGYRVLFWRLNSFEDADLDIDAFIGFVDLDIVNSGFRIGAANQYYLNVTDVNLHYEDEDASTELHVSLQPYTGAKLAAGAGGDVKIRFTYKVM